MSLDILMMGPMRLIEERLQPEFTIHRLWKESDLKAFLTEIGARVRGIVTYSGAASAVDQALLDRLPAVEIITNMGVGYESIDIASAKARHIPVTNAGAANAIDVAEHAIGLILAVGRLIAVGDRYIRDGRWPTEGRMPLTHRVSGRKVGILGLGNIGLEIAKRAVAFDMPVFYHNRTPRPDYAYQYVPTILELAREVDILVLATPGGDETRHLVNGDILNALGTDGVLINIARGTVVDQGALVEALIEGRLAGAGLDVFEFEPNVPSALFDLSNVVLQPHQSGATVEGVDAAVDMLVTNLRNHFSGKPIFNRVA